MKDDWSWSGPSLREETRIAKGHALELLITVVVVSTLLGLAINLGSSLLIQVLTLQQVLFAIGICVVVALVAIIVLAPSIFTTTKEFHNEIEIFLPLLASKQDVEVIRVKNYGNVTDLLHAALARRPAEERKHIAQILQSIHGNDTIAARQEMVGFVLELIQFLFVTQVVQRSAQLLGPQAAYHKFREIVQLQPSTVVSKRSELASQVPSNQYLQRPGLGVPEKIILPSGVDLYMPDTALEASSRSHSPQTERSKLEGITLLKAKVGRDIALGITAMAALSDYGFPKLTAPERGLTARCILRNARDQRLHDLALEEERAAAQLNDNGGALRRPIEVEPDPVTAYASLYTKLFEGGQRPYLLRVFVRLDGTFHIGLLISQKRQHGLYAWGTALAQLLALMDIEVFMATLKDAGQKTPRRLF
jgi:hypothetical protein